MTATGFLTEQDTPRFRVTYQMLSLLPAGSPLLRDCDQFGTWNIDQAWVEVPAWLHERVTAAIGGDDPAPQPYPDALQPPTHEREERGLRNLVEQAQRDIEEQAQRNQVRQLEEELEQLREPDTPPEQGLTATIRNQWVDTGTATWRNPFLLQDEHPDASYFIEIPDTIRVPHEIIENGTEREVVEHVVEQIHELQDELTQKLEPLMEWAHGIWSDAHAVPEQAAQGTPEYTDQPTEAGRRTDDEQRGTELPRYTLDYGVLDHERDELWDDE